MGYYTKNGGLIGSGQITTVISVHDLDVSRLYKTAVGGFPNSTQWNAARTYLSGFISEFQNASFYSYNLDGDEFTINDGGGDMYDGGNTTYPWFTSGSPNYSTLNSGNQSGRLSYSSTSITTTDTDFNWLSLGYSGFLPLSMLAYRTPGVSSTIGFQKSGNSGADGSGTLDSGVFYNGSTINTFVVYAFRRQTYNAGDPSHCDLYMILGHPNWSSVYGTIQSYADPVSNGGNGGYFYMSGATNVISICSLLSKSSGIQVTTAEMQTVINNWTSRLKIHFGY